MFWRVFGVLRPNKKEQYYRLAPPSGNKKGYAKFSEPNAHPSACDRVSNVKCVREESSPNLRPRDKNVSVACSYFCRPYLLVFPYGYFIFFIFIRRHYVALYLLRVVSLLCCPPASSIVKKKKKRNAFVPDIVNNDRKPPFGFFIRPFPPITANLPSSVVIVRFRPRILRVTRTLVRGGGGCRFSFAVEN